MKNVLYKEIAEDLGKSVVTINSWKKNHPVLLEYVKTGAFCKKNNISIEDIKACVQMKQLAKKND
jgi:uncharacterized protein YjcR